MLDLKAELERKSPVTTTTLTKPDFMLETFIRTTPERLWEALTSAALSQQYYIAGAGIHGTMKTDSSYEYLTKDGKVMLSGTILSADPPKRLEMTLPGWVGPNAKPSRNVYELETVGELTKLTILHFDIPAGQEGVKEGWVKIAASLKSLLETGEALKFG
ncbi:MAG: SRPBCC domain-containing protein [Parasphingorhabdus sp.]|nr:SRPBCC domain-containing protein [Parasphingorhabdus sp.]